MYDITDAINARTNDLSADAVRDIDAYLASVDADADYAEELARVDPLEAR